MIFYPPYAHTHTHTHTHLKNKTSKTTPDFTVELRVVRCQILFGTLNQCISPLCYVTVASRAEDTPASLLLHPHIQSCAQHSIWYIADTMRRIVEWMEQWSHLHICPSHSYITVLQEQDLCVADKRETFDNRKML
jgi:hypothetical protein